jgi:hypothetical protein
MQQSTEVDSRFQVITVRGQRGHVGFAGGVEVGILQRHRIVEVLFRLLSPSFRRLPACLSGARRGAYVQDRWQLMGRSASFPDNGTIRLRSGRTFSISANAARILGAEILTVCSALATRSNRRSLEV